MSNQLSLREIQNKIRAGLFKLVENVSGKSKVWKTFRQISDDSGLVKGFVACKTCLKILVYDSHSTGTSSLRKHECEVSRPSSSKTLDSYFDCTDAAAKKLTKEQKESILKLAVKYVCKDLRPFQSIYGQGFLDLAQGLINIGSSCGPLNCKLLMPDPTTVSRNIMKMACELRCKIIPELKAALHEASGAVTLDFWTDDFRKIAYLSFTVHYIDNTWTLKERILCTTKWDSSLPKTGDNVKAAVIQALRKYELDDMYPSLVYVTDRGSNMVAALKAVTRLNCSAHLLNNILRACFGEKGKSKTGEVTDENISVFRNAIDAGKSLVTYFKQSNLQSRLTKTLKTPVETRWNSLHSMFVSIQSQYHEVTDILIEKGELNRLDDLPLPLVESIVLFLQLFKHASDALEASKTPTLHLVMVWSKRLEQHLQSSPNDSEALCELKSKCLGIFRETFKAHMLHKLALFFHPKLKSLKIIDETERANVHSEVLRLLNERKQKLCLSESSSEGQKTSGQSRNEVTPAKKRRLELETLSDVEDTDDDSDDTSNNELQSYLDSKLQKTFGSSEVFELLKWWEKNSVIYPNLSLLARSVFAIPSTPSERDFSTAGYVIQERRTQLKPSTVDDILFLHSNLV